MSPKEVERLHAAYVRLSGLAIALDLAGYRASVWFEWGRHGWGEEELALVIRYIRRCIRNGERGFNSGTLRFNALIGQPDRFEEHLAEARQASRGNRIDPNWASVMRATGREDGGREAEDGVRRADRVAEKMVSDPAAAQRAFDEFLKLKEKLKSNSNEKLKS